LAALDFETDLSLSFLDFIFSFFLAFISLALSEDAPLLAFTLSAFSFSFSFYSFCYVTTFSIAAFSFSLSFLLFFIFGGGKSELFYPSSVMKKPFSLSYLI